MADGIRQLSDPSLPWPSDEQILADLEGGGSELNRLRALLMAGFWPYKIDGRKPWEIRDTSDRFFAAGDTVTFFEVVASPDGIVSTGRSFGPVTITYVLYGGAFCLDASHCCFTHTMPD